MRFYPERFFTIHNIALEVGAVSSVVAFTLIGSPALATLCIFAGTVGSLALRRVAPMPTLQPAGGTYHVGVRHIAGDPHSNRPPIAAYYPTHIAPIPRDTERWLPHEGDTRYADGLARYGGMPSFVLRHWSNIGMRCTRNAAPLQLWNPTSSSMRPIVVFSHGLAGHCRLYSCLAMDLAARGAIVIVPEHQDGSSCFSRDIHSTTEGCVFMKSTSAPEGSSQERIFREDQLAIRRREIEAVLRSVSSGWLFHALCFTAQDLVDVRERSHDIVPIALMGHSFGAATVIHTAVALTSAPLDASLQGVRITSVTAFDTWHLPLQHTTLPRLRELGLTTQAQSPPRQLPSLLLIHSEQWNLWAPAHSFQNELASAYRAIGGVDSAIEEVTAGTDHMSVCDIGVLSPVFSRKGATVKPRQQITSWARRALSHIGS